MAKCGNLQNLETSPKIQELEARINACGGISGAARSLGVSRETIRRAQKSGKVGRKLTHLLKADTAGTHAVPEPGGDNGRPPVPPPPPVQDADPPPEPEAGGGRVWDNAGILLAGLAGYLALGPIGAAGGALAADLIGRMDFGEGAEVPPGEYRPRKSRPTRGAKTVHAWKDPP